MVRYASHELFLLLEGLAEGTEDECLTPQRLGTGNDKPGSPAWSVKMPANQAQVMEKAPSVSITVQGPDVFPAHLKLQSPKLSCLFRVHLLDSYAGGENR